MLQTLLSPSRFLIAIPVFLVSFAVFALLWLAATGLVAHLGGWRTLAEAYPAPDSLSSNDGAERFRWASMGFGWGLVTLGNYRNAVTITLGPRGLALASSFLFGFRHPPILVPWRAVKVCEEGRTFGTPWVRLEFANGQRLRVYGRPVDGIVERAASARR